MIKVKNWVILRNDKIIEKDKDLKTILRLAEKYDTDEIIISFNPVN